MISHKKLIVWMLVWSGIAYGMEEQMTKLKLWEDIAPFAGKVVAFKTINPVPGGYTNESNQSQYAYISSKANHANWNSGFTAKILLYGSIKRKCQDDFILNNTYVSNSELEIRNISAEEKKELLYALKSKNAQFLKSHASYHMDKRTDIILSLVE